MGSEPFLIEALRDVAEALHAGEIPFALAGGLAFSALVEPRATSDIDLLLLARPDRKAEILSALHPFFDGLLPHADTMHLQHAEIWRVVGVRKNREIILDFLLGGDEFHRHALERSRSLRFSGQDLQLVTLEDLYILKARAGRPQDLLDIATLERLKGDALDRAYLARWNP